MIQFVFVKELTNIDSNHDYLNKTIDSVNEKLNIKNDLSYHEDGKVMVCEFSDDLGSTCTLIMSIATYNNVKQLQVQINIIDPENFNELAYQLKITIKNLLRRDWGECIWLVDSQSSLFAKQLYPKMYEIENKLRMFINIVMVTKIGVQWWDNYVSENIFEKYKLTHVDQKRVAPHFKNVDAKLISIDTDHLTDIMTYKQKEWIPKYSEEIRRLIVSNDQKSANGLKDSMKDQLEVSLDLWEEIFSNYFDEEFLTDWNTFCKNRNHKSHCTQ